MNTLIEEFGVPPGQEMVMSPSERYRDRNGFDEKSFATAYRPSAPYSTVAFVGAELSVRRGGWLFSTATSVAQNAVKFE